MESDMESTVEDDFEVKPRRKRRKRGSSQFWRRMKRRVPASTKTVHAESVSDKSSVETGATSGTGSQGDISIIEESSACRKALDEPHVCSASESCFSETATEFYHDSDVTEVKFEDKIKERKKKKRKKSSLGFRRKQGRKKTSKLEAKPGAYESSDDSGSELLGDFSSTFDLSDLDDISDISISDEAISVSKALPVFHAGAERPDDQSISTGACHVGAAGRPSELDSYGTAVSKLKAAAESSGSSYISSRADNYPSSAPDDDTPAPLSLQASMSSLREKVALLLPNDWDVNVVGSILRMYTLNFSKNVAVEASMYYDIVSATVGLFYHGKSVPKESPAFQYGHEPDIENVGSVADYLAGVIRNVQTLIKCEGVTEHREQWNIMKGYLDYNSEPPCFRSKKCMLLMKSKNSICVNCKEELKKFVRYNMHLEKEAEHDFHSIPDTNLSKESIKIKKDSYKKLYKVEKQRSNRLENRLNSLKLKLDAAMKDELLFLLRENQHKMTDVQKIFWLSQAKALAVHDKRSMRWHPMLIRLALHLHSLSDNAYQFLNETKMLTLPSSRRLYDYSHFIEAKEGCQEELISHIVFKIKKYDEDHFSYLNLMFDEMHIRSGLVISRSTGELVGYTRLEGVERELSEMQHELEAKVYKPKLAKKVLVYLAQGITSDVKDIVAVYSTDDLSAGQLFHRTWDVIYHLEEAGLQVLTVTCDGASVNRRFINMHESLDHANYTYCTLNLAAGVKRKLFFIVDPPHLVKTIRNAFANSFSHRKSRKLWKNGEFLSWQVIENIYELTKAQKYTGHKLTKAHVRLSSYSCMTVQYATQVLSSSVAKCIMDHSNHERLKLLDTSEVVHFIKLMDKFFDCVNGKELESGEEHCNPDKAPYTDLDDSRLKFLEEDFLNYFDEWKQDILHRPGIFSDAEKCKMIISHQALGSLQISVKSIVGAIRYMLEVGKAPSVSARIFNQDPLEQYFGKIRRKQGDNRQPGLKSVLDTRINLHSQGHVAVPPQKGNTEAVKRQTLQLDSTPLPSRKRRRSKE